MRRQRTTIVLIVVALVAVGGAAAALRGGGGDDDGPDCRLGLYRESPKEPRPPAGAWRREPRMPAAPVEGSATATDDALWATNGSAPHDLRRMLRFELRTRRWDEPTRSPVGLNHLQPVAYEGDVVLAGGFLEGERETGRAFRYDPEADRWSELPPMRVPRGGAAAGVIGHRLYVAGGGPNDYIETRVSGDPTLEIYDFRTRRWSRGPDMPTGRHHTTGAVVDGKLYVVGGRDRVRQSLDTVERFDPASGRWERLPPLPLGVSAAGATGADGKLVVVGGADETNWQEGGGWVTPSAWSFDPRSNRWSRLPDLRTERRGFGAVYAGGRVYALAGSPCSGLKRSGPVGTPTAESLRLPVRR